MSNQFKGAIPLKDAIDRVFDQNGFDEIFRRALLGFAIEGVEIEAHTVDCPKPSTGEIIRKHVLGHSVTITFASGERKLYYLPNPWRVKSSWLRSLTARGSE